MATSFPKYLLHYTCPEEMYTSSNFSTFSCAPGIVNVSKFSPSCGWVVGPHYNFNVHFSSKLIVLTIFTWAYYTFAYLLGGYLFESFAHFCVKLLFIEL